MTKVDQSYRILRIAAFSDDDRGGNPAGVVVGTHFPAKSVMQRIAQEIGYSETVFAMPHPSGWRVRYFAPTMEVPFCGHATIALGAGLAALFGSGRHALVLNKSEIEVHGRVASDGRLSSTLRSPRTDSGPVSSEVIAEALELFGLQEGDLCASLAPAIVTADARFLLLPIEEPALLPTIGYHFERGREFMQRNGFVTIACLSPTTPMMRVRNFFAAGGVYEDSATGAAAAAIAGYLHRVGWPLPAPLTVLQGVEAGRPSRLCVAPDEANPRRMLVSGGARLLSFNAEEDRRMLVPLLAS